MTPVTYLEVQERIAQLRADRATQETLMVETFRAYATTINPVAIAKETIHSLVKDNEVQRDGVKLGLNLGADFLIYQLMGRNKGVMGFFSSLLAEKVSSTLINGNMTDIVKGGIKLYHKYISKKDEPVESSS